MAVEGLTCPEKAVLLVLSVMANPEGVAWPSIAQLAERASIGRRTAFEATARLEALELIRRDTSPGKGTHYTILLDPCASRTGAPAAPVRDTHPTRAPAAPKQPMNNQRKKKASPSPSARTPNGTRLDPETDAPADWIAWACTERGWDDAAAAYEFATFRDYWIAQPGAKGRKADWPATWRNWVRRSRRATSKDNQHGRRGQPVPSGSGARGSRPDPALDLRRMALAEIEAEERAAADQAARGGPWLALPPERGG